MSIMAVAVASGPGPGLFQEFSNVSFSAFQEASNVKFSML